MQLFKIIFLVLIFIISIFANENDEQNWNYFGEFQTYFAKIDKSNEHPQVKNYSELLNYNSIQLNIDYYNDGFYFSVTPYAYTYYTESDEKIKSANFPEPFQVSDFFFRTFYMSYTMDKLTYGAGVLPLSNSFPMQYTSDYYQDGEGLSIVSDIDPLGFFIKYRFNDTNKIFAGIGLLDTSFVPAGNYLNEHQRDDSYGIFLTQKITYDKFKIINDFKYSNIMYNGVQAGKFYNLGSGISWNDSEHSGWTLYNVLAFSLYENNTIAVRDEILSDIGLAGVPTQFASSFVFDDKTYTGAANLFGFRKDLDIFSFDSFINFEWFHTFNDWISGNKGSLYNSNFNQLSNIRNNSYFINYGVRINELTTLKLNYAYLEFKEIVNIGAPSSTPVKESIGSQRSSKEIVKLSFSYKF
ncbi:MAG: hypothetical protein U9N02_00045 [Campylobacterota bacterium]|nr:hypothetical protein [Campylobacterota bacterium]